MLSRETVFIIGAGASFELGLPLGETLKTEIAGLLDIQFAGGFKQTNGDYQIANALRSMADEKAGTSFNDLLEKCWLLRDALPGSISIDNLIDAHRNDPEIAEIGKLGITKAILAAERKSKLYRRADERDEILFPRLAGSYLIPLFQIMTEGVAKEEAAKIFSNVTFIVFNYDRTIERFFPLALRRYYGFDQHQAEALFSEARIVHPYGRVGEFGKGKSLTSAAFGADRCDLRSIAQGIRTFSEGVAEEDDQDEIAQIIKSADRAVFLGFAFHPLNMAILETETLGPNEFGRIDAVFGTTIGLSDAAVRSVTQAIANTFSKRPPTGRADLIASQEFSELNLEPRSASDFLFAHFRSLA